MGRRVVWHTPIPTGKDAHRWQKSRSLSGLSGEGVGSEGSKLPAQRPKMTNPPKVPCEGLTPAAGKLCQMVWPCGVCVVCKAPPLGTALEVWPWRKGRTGAGGQDAPTHESKPDIPPYSLRSSTAALVGLAPSGYSPPKGVTPCKECRGAATTWAVESPIPQTRVSRLNPAELGYASV